MVKLEFISSRIIHPEPQRWGLRLRWVLLGGGGGGGGGRGARQIGAHGGTVGPRGGSTSHCTTPSASTQMRHSSGIPRAPRGMAANH